LTDADAFIRAIIAEPDDDVPRLVYADWLDERGDPRGEFIRVQCALASWPPCLRSHFRDEFEGGMCLECQGLTNPLRRRERELLDEFWAKWCHQTFDHIAPDVGVSSGGDNLRIRLYDRKPRQDEIGEFEATFTRGFVGSVTLSWTDFQTHADALLSSAPIRRVNRPRACGACGGRRMRLPPTPHGLPCLKCRGTGRVDHWVGDGRVVLTTWPDVATHRDEANGRTAFRLAPNGKKVLTMRDDEAAYAGPGWSAEMMGQLLVAEYPGVDFGLPAVYGESDVRRPSDAAGRQAIATLTGGRP
jgi:uncharacterized protein (TIGR02996 family)